MASRYYVLTTEDLEKLKELIEDAGTMDAIEFINKIMDSQ